MSILKNKNILENLARITLIEMCGYNADDLYCDDCPDIQSLSGTVGIEVVSDVFENEQKAMRFIEKIWGVPIKEIPTEQIDNLKRLGASVRTDVNGCINTGHLGESENNPQHLIKTVTNKLIKLNGGGYSIFPENDLYVFVETLVMEMCESYIYNVIEFVRHYAIQSKIIKYNRLFLDQYYIL